jgi:hypothetical protein
MSLACLPEAASVLFGIVVAKIFPTRLWAILGGLSDMGHWCAFFVSSFWGMRNRALGGIPCVSCLTEDA